MNIGIKRLISEAECYETMREIRWADGVKCPICQSENIKRNGHVSHELCCQKYECKQCGRYFDDLTGTIFSGHHKPVTTWILCLYFMGLNLSNSQIAHELEIDESDVYQMTTQLREGIEEKTPDVILSGTVEFDEVYIVAGHKGHPDEVKKRGVMADETG
jgi:transposase-like protein